MWNKEKQLTLLNFYHLYKVKTKCVELFMNTKDINIDNYNYNLPDERIAKYPLSKRDESKLLVYKQGNISESSFYNLPKIVPSSSLMVFNNTKVIQARIYFRKTTGALIEIFLLEPAFPNDYELIFQTTKKCSWHCMIGNQKKWKEGKLELKTTINNKEIILIAQKDIDNNNSNIIHFEWNCEDMSFAELIDCVGELPIPPYLNRETKEQDKVTYQTVYSKIKGSVAAPTAGLHFTDNVLQQLLNNNVKREELTLHVGAGTFKPVKSKHIGEHEMHTEFFTVKRSTIEQLINNIGNIIAVGTTSVRTLESLYFIGVKLEKNHNLTNDKLCVLQWEAYELKENDKISVKKALQNILEYIDKNKQTCISSNTQIIIAPGFEYRVVNAIVTNFHQPKSTLLLLISAFLKENNWKKIYNYALTHDFRFLSYGDSSILFP